MGTNYIPPTAPTYTVQLLEQCLIQLHCWFCHNGLALNPDKSEAIWFSTRQSVASLPPAASVNIAGSVIPESNSLKIHGVTLDSHLSLDQHVSSGRLTSTCALCATSALALLLLILIEFNELIIF